MASLYVEELCHSWIKNCNLPTFWDHKVLKGFHSLCSFPKKTLLVSTKHVYFFFFFFWPNHSLFDQCVHSTLKSWSLPLYLLAKSNLWRFCFLDSKQNACYAGHICAICLIIDAWTLTHISSYRFCNEIWGFLETFFPPSGAFWLNLLNVYIW